MKRKIYDELINWKNNQSKKPLMVLGVRQSGKTYIIDEFCKSEFEHYKYLNLFEQDNIVALYNSSLTSDEKYNRLKVLIDFDLDQDNAILFIRLVRKLQNTIKKSKNMVILNC